MMDRKTAVDFLVNRPADFGKMVGFTKLGDLHNEWIRKMLLSKEDVTLQAHRESYKTSCVSVALCLIMVLFPNKRICFIRKTGDDVKEVVKQVSKMLQDSHTQYFVNAVYGVNLRLTKASSTELSTNLTTDVRGTSQLVGLGLGASLTGKHFDYIYTDDIVNISDRISRADREYTKLIYQELQNIRNRGGRIFNTGTPWHKDDCFNLMPNPEVYDCYTTGLMDESVIQQKRENMTASLFAANYELRHIAAEDVIFDRPQVGADVSLAEQGLCHVDAAYGGGDFTAFTICNRRSEKVVVDGEERTVQRYYVFGKMWHKNVEDVMDEICKYRADFNAGKIYNEDNADKGYLARDLRKRGERVVVYHENMNKFLKITSYLKAIWKDVVFVDGTDKEYIEQICDFNENAEHDDAPDSLACLARVWSKKHTDGEYRSIMM